MEAEIQSVVWLRKGDRNFKYFHTKAFMRRHKNKISLLLDTRGEWVEGAEAGSFPFPVPSFSD